MTVRNEATDQPRNRETPAPLTDLQEILNLAGIDIPETATITSITPVEKWKGAYNYNIEFTAPDDDAMIWVSEITSVPFDALSIIEGPENGLMLFVKRVFGLDEVPTTSRFVKFGATNSPKRCNVMIILNGPDFTRVNLGIEPMDG